METDSALWEHLRNEETRLRAFEVLVERHYTQVKGWIRRWVHDEALTEDLTQETFLRAWEKCHTFRGEAQFSSWLYTIARREAFRALHKRSIWRWVPWLWEGVETLDTPEEDPLITVEEIERGLATAVERLTPIQKAVWQAVWEERLPYKEVAARLGISENTVKAHVHQIRQRLRKSLGRE